MAKREKPGGGAVSVRTETYKGHEILYPPDQRRKKIFIDGRPVKWGETGGTFYLDVYAYDRGKTLEETVERYIDYLEKARTRGEEGR
jgi:hypothetical protein